MKKSLPTLLTLNLLVAAIMTVSGMPSAHADSGSVAVVIGDGGYIAGYQSYSGYRAYGDYGAYLRNRGVYRRNYRNKYSRRYGYRPSPETIIVRPIVIRPIVRPYGIHPHRHGSYRYGGRQYGAQKRFNTGLQRRSFSGFGTSW